MDIRRRLHHQPNFVNDIHTAANKQQFSGFNRNKYGEIIHLRPHVLGESHPITGIIRIIF